jgi:hypothetical protein
MTEEELVQLQEDNLGKTYPSIGLAYDLAASSLDLPRARWDAMDNRIQSLVTINTTISGAFIVFLSDHGLPIVSWRFRIAMTAFAAGIVLALIARWRGELQVVSPSKLFDKYLGLNQLEFKTQIIHILGDIQNANIKELKLKHRLTVGSMVAFGFGIICLAAWAVV